MGLDLPGVMAEEELPPEAAILDEPPMEEPPPEQIPPGTPLESNEGTPPPTEKQPIGVSTDLTEEEKDALKYVLDTITVPDDEIREKMVPIWQMYENYWRGLQDLIYDTERGAFVSPNGVIKAAGEMEDNYIGSKIVNVYRAHGESIAAAISSDMPIIKFFPEDADDPQDITTAKAYSTASEFVADDNQAKLLNLRAIYTRWNQPFVAYYNTYVYDEKYGTIEKRSYKTQEVEVGESFCPSCLLELPVQTPNGICPECGSSLMESSSMETVPVLDEVHTIPKGKEKIEVYGPRHVRLPYNVVNLEQAGYLILETEHHYAQLQQLYPQMTEDVKSGSPATGSTADTARRARTAAEGGEPDRDQRTLQRCWFRTWALNIIEDEGIRASLKAKFPRGVQVTFADEIYCEAYDESMDDHWTLIPDPFAEHIHGDPLGKPEIPIQDMTNDVVHLTLETILFGIPDRFADPTVLNFDKYQNSEKAPGNVYPAKRPTGMGLDSGFFEGRAATLSDNVEIFRQSLEHYGQFVTGDTPGVHGGPLPKGSSRTADEYRQAKQGALQRLSVVWYLINIAWALVMKKAVNELRIHMRFQGEDVKFVKEAGKGFTNVWIKLADIDDGNVGRVRAENAESFPLTTEQKRGAILELLQTGLPPLIEWLMMPENIGEMSRVMIGMSNFKIPGEEDREYQLWEINNILSGQMVEVDPDMDNHAIHVQVLKSWAASEDGRKTKMVNPQGYMMVLEHLQMHTIILEQQMMAQQMAAAAQEGPPPGKGGQGEKSGAAEPMPPAEG